MGEPRRFPKKQYCRAPGGTLTTSLQGAKLHAVQSGGAITELLRAWSEGDRGALDALVPLVYSELRRMASSYLKSEPDMATIQPTVLVHEAYLRLAGPRAADLNCRAHFFGVASRIMRQILVDRARRRNARKRSGGIRVPLEDTGVVALTTPRAALLVSLDEALRELEQQDPEKARILEQKYFSGMTAEESAEVLGIPTHKVQSQMRLAQAWLRRELTESAPEPPVSSPDLAEDSVELRMKQ
jgi:RNA polymerase sigma-70 factor (ECF subfamily)